MNNKEIVFLIKVMCGGGAERVITLLSNAMVQKGFDVTFIITHQKKDDAVLLNFNPDIKIISLPDEVNKLNAGKLIPFLISLLARISGKIETLLLKNSLSKSRILKYIASNYKDIKWLKTFFKKHKNSSVVAFMYDASFYTLLSATKSNKVIISERGDPQQSTSSKTTMALIKNLFPKADDFVFQSPDVQKWYEKNTPVRGKVIFNPIKSDLPAPYVGERKKRIVNFCRISAQKNLIMLADAFAEFRKDFPDYELDIIGDPVGNNADGYIDSVVEHVRKLGCENYIHILPAIKDIHSVIKDYAMFVSSSDFEGMSNSMLEAMAMGLPCVCTDCPAGGARAVIKDGENGTLSPVGDSHALYLAMKKVIENPDLAQKISKNAVKIREDQSAEKITEEWMELING